MDDYDTRILVDAKIEYTKYFIRILKKHFFEGISSLFDNALEISNRNYNQVFMIFQDLLKDIPKWNQNTIDDETTRIMECSECEFLEDLLTAVFVSHTKILSVIRVNKKNKKINLNIPKLNNFIHKCYIEIAREFWKTPIYFNNNIPATEIQKNYRICEEIISNCINETIRKLLPIKYILKESLGEDYEEDESFDSEDIQKSISSNEENNLKKLVQKEIHNLYKSKGLLNEDLNEEESNLLTKNESINNDLIENEKDSNLDINIISKNTDNINNENENNNLIDLLKEENNINEDSNNNIKNIEINGGSRSIKVNDLISENNNSDSLLINNFENNNLEEKNLEDKNLLLNNKNITDPENNIDTEINNYDPEKKIIDLENKNNSENNNNLIEKNENNVISINTSDSKIESNDTLNDNIIVNDLNEIDLGTLSNNSDVIKLDNNYNVVSDDLYENFNNKNNIQNEVLNDLNKNKKESVNFFDDAIEIENL